MCISCFNWLSKDKSKSTIFFECSCRGPVIFMVAISLQGYSSRLLTGMQNSWTRKQLIIIILPIGHTLKTLTYSIPARKKKHRDGKKRCLQIIYYSFKTPKFWKDTVTHINHSTLSCPQGNRSTLIVIPRKYALLSQFFWPRCDVFPWRLFLVPLASPNSMVSPSLQAAASSLLNARMEVASSVLDLVNMDLLISSRGSAYLNFSSLVSGSIRIFIHGNLRGQCHTHPMPHTPQK